MSSLVRRINIRINKRRGMTRTDLVPSPYRKDVFVWPRGYGEAIPARGKDLEARLSREAKR